MRATWFLLPLMLVSGPALAAPGDPALPSELTDPAMADRLGQVMGALTRAFLDLPVGELEAAAQGRQPVPADRTRRLRDHLGGEGAEREVEASITASGRRVQAMAKALIDSLPSIMASFENVEREIERKAANLPDPAYPRR